MVQPVRPTLRTKIKAFLKKKIKILSPLPFFYFEKEIVHMIWKLKVTFTPLILDGGKVHFFLHNIFVTLDIY